MNEEMEALQKNATWKLILLTEGKKTIGFRWVFTVKLKVNGRIDRYKVRLVAKGYTQRYGVDYQETFAPVAKINIICIFIFIAVNRDWPLQQFDVKNAFLSRDLEEEVYMELLLGIKHSYLCKRKVGKLKKSLYGLKQSPKAWFGRSILKELGVEYTKPMNLYCDNEAAIEIAQNLVQRDRTKHVEIDRHFIKENLDQKVMQFPFVQSEGVVPWTLVKLATALLALILLITGHLPVISALVPSGGEKSPSDVLFCGRSRSWRKMFLGKDYGCSGSESLSILAQESCLPELSSRQDATHSTIAKLKS
ncbi:Uncharacterized protein TCM_012183 [Theobroma cacao]|uniref:Reverse transcriptase Ty1/copia-type domain-containing protein n=1 Tax=Theobroma cacao TaxID=3641 RepID=A0A061G1C5_THECC|nr:Uncharacterized protein TCM_012183 [Theobroma cacao]